METLNTHRKKDNYSNIILQVLGILMLSGYVAGNETTVLEEAINNNLLAAFLLVTSLLFSSSSCKCISFPSNSYAPFSPFRQTCSLD